MRAAVSGDLERSGTYLVRALDRCPRHPDAVRELAALRFHQGRYPEAVELAERYLALNPTSSWAWDVLASSRYLSDDPLGALEAWNRIDRPMLAGDSTQGRSLVTPEVLLQAERTLTDLPAVDRARVDYRPLPEGRALLDTALVVGRRNPLRTEELPVHAFRALRGTVRLTATDLLNRLDHWELQVSREGRLEEAHLRLTHPLTGRRGLLAWEASMRRGTFSPAPEAPAFREEVASLRAHYVRRASARLRAGLHVGYDRRRVAGGAVAVGAVLELQGDPAPRFIGGEEFGDGEPLWAFRWTSTALVASSSSAHSLLDASARRPLEGGFELAARAGAEGLTSGSPVDLGPRFGADRMATRLMRARRSVDDDGIVRSAYPGRGWLTGGIELRRWARGSTGGHLGAAVFADAVRALGTRRPSAPRSDLHLGVGIRIRGPAGLGGMRLDWAIDPGAGTSRGSAGWSRRF